MALHVVYQNVQGLRTKLSTFKLNLLASMPDIVCISETWLNKNIMDCELIDPQKYTIFRRDRESSASKKLDGGGVSIVVKNKYSASVLTQYCSDAEDIWLSIRLNELSTLTVCCVYLPPGDKEAYASFSSKLANISFSENTSVLVCGDFNFSTMKWVQLSNNLFLDPYNIDNAYSSLILNLSYHNLMQFNTVFNCDNKLLDLIYSNKVNVIELSRCDNPLVQEKAIHPCIEFLCEVHHNKQSLSFNNNTYFNFKKGNYPEINKELSSISWADEFKGKSLNSCVDMFYYKTNELITEFIPNFTKNKYFPTFYRSNTIRTVKEKNKAHKKWRLFKNPSDYNIFKQLRTQSKKMIDSDFRAYVGSVEGDLATNPNRFWNYASIKKQNVSKIPNELCWNSEVARNGRDISDLFKSYFSSVFEPESHSFDLQSINCSANNIDLHSVILDRSQVKKILLSADPKKGAGPDGVPPIFYKKTADAICEPLLLIYNKSLSTGEFPTLWRSAMLIPILKSGRKKDVTNYRPISKMSAAAKFFEKIVYEYLFNLVKNVISPQQHGFFRGRSIDTNLFSFINYIHEHLDNQGQVDAVYTDFSKAFDKISHNVLLKRLAEVGVGGVFLKWFASYIREWRVHVSLQGFKSEFFTPSSGVPQGSHLGPLLFIIYIDQIKHCFEHCQFEKFADDLKFYRLVQSIEDCEKIQSDLDRLKSFCDQNNLFLNIKKCQSISFSRKKIALNYDYKIDNNNLPRVEHVRDLGIIIDSKLMFDMHIDLISSDASRLFGFVSRKCAQFTNVKAIVCLFNAFVLGKLSFGSIIWNPRYGVYRDRLESVQNKLLKFISFKEHFLIQDHDYSAAREHFNIISLANRRKITDVMFLFNIINSHYNAPSILSDIHLNTTNTNLRSTERFFVPFRRTSCSQNSPLCRIVRVGNVVNKSIDFFATSQTVFKKLVRRVMRDSPSQFDVL